MAQWTGFVGKVIALAGVLIVEYLLHKHRVAEREDRYGSRLSQRK